VGRRRTAVITSSASIRNERPDRWGRVIDVTRSDAFFSASTSFANPAVTLARPKPPSASS
jgi:hypothetical protein